MGKIARRTTAVGAFTLAGALALSTAASADPVDGPLIDIDGDPDVWTSEAPYIYRFADETRVLTAIQAAERTDRDHWGDTVIIASSESYTDALAAAPLADAVDAPILLSPNGDSIDGDVLDYIADDGFDRVILVGGTDVFSNDVLGQLTAYDVERYAGSNRYQTAIELALGALSEGDYSDDFNVFLASGQNFPDALAAGPSAADDNGVVLLTVGDQGLDAATYTALTASGLLQEHNSIAAIGGPAAEAAENGAVSGSGLDPIEVDIEIVGANRYETAVMAAQEFIFDEMERGEMTNIAIASGENFPDAVVAGAYAANVDGALLLTKQESLTHVTADALEGLRLDVQNVFVFGGPGAVAPIVSQQIADLDWRY